MVADRRFGRVPTAATARFVSMVSEPGSEVKASSASSRSEQQLIKSILVPAEVRSAIQKVSPLISICSCDDRSQEVGPGSRSRGDKEGWRARLLAEEEEWRARLLVEEEEWRARLLAEEEEWRARLRASDERWNSRLQALKKLMNSHLSIMKEEAPFEALPASLLGRSPIVRSNSQGRKANPGPSPKFNSTTAWDVIDDDMEEDEDLLDDDDWSEKDNEEVESSVEKFGLEKDVEDDELLACDELLVCDVESIGDFTDKDQTDGQLKISAPSTNTSMLTETSGLLSSVSNGGQEPELHGPSLDGQNKANAMNMVISEFEKSLAYKDNGIVISFPALMKATIGQVISTVGITEDFEVDVSEHYMLVFDSPVEDMRVLCYDPGGSFLGVFLIGIPARDIGATMDMGPKTVVDEAGAVDAFPSKRVGINAKHVLIFDPGGDQLSTGKGDEQKFDKDVEKHYKEVGCDVVDSKRITDLLMAPIVQSKNFVSKAMSVHLRRPNDLITRLDSSINSVALDMRSTLAEVVVTASCKDSEVERPKSYPTLIQIADDLAYDFSYIIAVAGTSLWWQEGSKCVNLGCAQQCQKLSSWVIDVLKQKELLTAGASRVVDWYTGRGEEDFLLLRLPTLVLPPLNLLPYPTPLSTGSTVKNNTCQYIVEDEVELSTADSKARVSQFLLVASNAFLFLYSVVFVQTGRGSFVAALQKKYLRVILMKLLYYYKVKPADNKFPCFRGCSERELS